MLSSVNLLDFLKTAHIFVYYLSIDIDIGCLHLAKPLNAERGDHVIASHWSGRDLHLYDLI